MKFVPSPAQQIATEFLSTHEWAALYMGCGLGKTGTVLHAAADLIASGESNGCLIVAPLRVCNLTWPAEAAKWDMISPIGMLNLRTKEGMEAFDVGVERRFYVTNYERLQAHARDWEGRKRLPFNIVVFDEISKAKAHDSKRINAFRPIVKNYCKFRWGLTGTPAPNSLLDVFAQIRLLDGGRTFGPSFQAFKHRYFQQDDCMGYSWSIRPSAGEAIYEKLKGIAITLKSSDWLDIPDVVQEDIEVPLPRGVISDDYDKLEKDYLLQIRNSDADICAVNAAVLANKLLQYTSGAAYDDMHNWHLLHNVKLAALAKLMQKLRGKPAIVLYQFKHELERMKEHSEELGGVTAFSDAKTGDEQEELVARWNRGEIPLLAAHPKSLAHGLNLQEGGSTVIWLTPTWSREDYDQAIARVARRGQMNITTVYRIISTGTIDEAVMEALREKDGTQNALLNALRRYAETKG